MVTSVLFLSTSLKQIFGFWWKKCKKHLFFVGAESIFCFYCYLKKKKDIKMRQILKESYNYTLSTVSWQPVGRRIYSFCQWNWPFVTHCATKVDWLPSHQNWWWWQNKNNQKWFLLKENKFAWTNKMFNGTVK